MDLEQTPRRKGRFLQRAWKWLADERGNIGPILALMVVPIVGSFAIGGETASWYLYHRAQQNAADSAVVAAAIQGGTTYADVAKAVATKYGFTTGGNVTVTPTTVACPAGATVISGATCYQVTVANNVPVYLTRVVGYSGDVTLANGARGKAISAKAIAGLTTGTTTFCMIGLSGGITLNGGPGTNLTGCDLLSDKDLACNGLNSDFGVGGGYAVGTNKNNDCGTTPVSGYPAFTDPLASTMSSNLSKLSCTYAASSTFSQAGLATGDNCYTGQVKLASDVTISTPNTVLVIQTDASGNGGLNLNGHTLSTSGDGSVTIVFTGTTALNGAVIPSNGGTLNIAAPKLNADGTTNSGWDGIAIAEDPSMPDPKLSGQTNVLDMNFSGGSNQITLDISGLIYLPTAVFNVSGAINKASNGLACIGIVAQKIVASGTNDIFANPTSQCRQQQNLLPTVPMVALLQ